MTIGLTTQQQTVVDVLSSSGRYVGGRQVLDEAIDLLRQRDDLRVRLRPGIEELNQGLRRPLEEVNADFRRSRTDT